MDYTNNNTKDTETNSRAMRSVAVNDPEVFIGLVGPIGTDHDEVSRMLTRELEELGYGATVIKYSKLLHKIPNYAHLAQIKEEEKRYKEHMAAGTELRKTFRQGSALSQLAVSRIWSEREKLHRQNNEKLGEEGSRIPVRRHAYILNSLKHPDEVRFLRQVYGAHFYLLGIHTPRDQRLHTLSERLAKSNFQSDPQNWRHIAEELLNIDESEGAEKLGQNVRGTYPESDYFIVSKTNKQIKDGVERFIRLAFNHPFESPTVAEMSMFHAKATAMRSTDLSRQVGAAIVEDNGRIIANGCNDVPKAGGGQYWGKDANDYRDFQHGLDSNAKYKVDTLVEILGRLKASVIINDQNNQDIIQSIIDEVREKGASGIFEGARVTNVIEFGRMIHAEMAAIAQAAQYGLPVGGTTLYCTTFPCHMCARHIIATGIKRVVYIEPYPKSLAKELYSDSIVLDPDWEVPGYVSFVPYEGAAPRRFGDFFEKFKRKDELDRALTWKKRIASPKADRLISVYPSIEGRVIEELERKFTEHGLSNETATSGGRAEDEQKIKLAGESSSTGAPAD